MRGTFAILQVSEVQAVLLTTDGLQFGGISSTSAIKVQSLMGNCWLFKRLQISLMHQKMKPNSERDINTMAMSQG